MSLRARRREFWVDHMTIGSRVTTEPRHSRHWAHDQVLERLPCSDSDLSDLGLCVSNLVYDINVRELRNTGRRIVGESVTVVTPLGLHVRQIVYRLVRG